MHTSNIVLVLAAALALSACGPTGKQQPEDPAPAPAPTCIGVLPVRPDSAEQVGGSAETTRSLADGAAVVDGILRDALRGNDKARFLDPAQAGPLLQSDAPNLEAARTAAQTTGCNALLETRLTRYVEREGGPYGAQRPAAVTVGYRLYNVETGTVLCHGRFDEQQQSLMENLFSLGKAGRRGMTWLTAEELSRDGLRELIQKCPHLAE